MGQEAMSLREVLSDERRLSGSYPAMHCASAQRPPGCVGKFIDAEVPNLHRSTSAWGRGQGYFIHGGETETGASLLISKAQTSAEKSLIQSRVKYSVLYGSYAPDSLRNIGHVNDPTLTAMLKEQRRTKDLEARKQLIFAIQQYEAEQQ